MSALSKLKCVYSSFNVDICDNGFKLSAEGRDNNNDWSEVKLVCKTTEELSSIIGEISKIPLYSRK